MSFSICAESLWLFIYPIILTRTKYTPPLCFIIQSLLTVHLVLSLVQSILVTPIRTKLTFIFMYNLNIEKQGPDSLAYFVIHQAMFGLTFLPQELQIYLIDVNQKRIYWCFVQNIENLLSFLVFLVFLSLYYSFCYYVLSIFNFLNHHLLIIYFPHFSVF